MKVFFSFLVLIGITCGAEVTTEKPEEQVGKEDLKTAETFGIGFYSYGGWYPYSGYYYGYPYGGYFGYPHKKFFGIGYPYYGIKAYPALPVWG